MHVQNVLQRVAVEDLDEEGVLVACLGLQLDDVSVCVVYVLVVQWLVEFPLEFLTGTVSSFFVTVIFFGHDCEHSFLLHA